MRLFVRFWFLILLAFGACLAFLIPEISHGIQSSGSSRPLIFFIFVFNGLTTPTKHLYTALRRVREWCSGLVMIFFIAPLISLAAAVFLLSRWPDLQTGVLLLGVLPTTISSSIVITEIAMGDRALALCISLISNLIGVLSLGPSYLFLLKLVGVGESVGVAVKPSAIIGDLLLTVFLPFVCGQLIRPWRWRFADRCKPYCDCYCQLAIIVMAMSAIGSARPKLLEHSGEAPLIVAAALGLHLAFLSVGSVLSRIATGTRPTQWAIMITGSQKTMVIGFLVWERFLSQAFPLGALPLVIFHPLQLLIDGSLAAWQRDAVMKKGDCPT